MTESGAYHAALWPMIETWRLAVQTLNQDVTVQSTWLSFLDTLDFNEESKENRVAQLDQFIDQAEAVLADWKNAYGI